MKYKITQLKILVKKSTKTMIEGLNELIKDHSKKPFHSQLDEAKGPKMDCQDMVGYDPLHPEFLQLPPVNLHSTHRKYAEFNQPLSKIF